MKRCFGNSDLYIKYHDEEWGVPVHDDRLLFEMLILEGAQAGLNWETVLKKRSGYKEAFYNFDREKVAAMSDNTLETLRNNRAIIRNRAKIYSARQNARIFLAIAEEFGSFDHYLWGFVNHKPLLNHWKNLEEMPTQTEISDRLSKDLKRRGMKFVGSTIIYAYMQAVGLVNDHTVECPFYHARERS